MRFLKAVSPKFSMSNFFCSAAACSAVPHDAG
jgi:hypothetical protein